MRDIITTYPQFLVLFFGMFVLVGVLDFLVRKYGSPGAKAQFLTGDDRVPEEKEAGIGNLENRVRQLEEAVSGLQAR